jgi:hypothetical protein
MECTTLNYGSASSYVFVMISCAHPFPCRKELLAERKKSLLEIREMEHREWEAKKAGAS